MKKLTGSVRWLCLCLPTTTTTTTTTTFSLTYRLICLGFLFLLFQFLPFLCRRQVFCFLAFLVDLSVSPSPSCPSPFSVFRLLNFFLRGLGGLPLAKLSHFEFLFQAYDVHFSLLINLDIFQPFLLL